MSLIDDLIANAGGSAPAVRLAGVWLRHERELGYRLSTTGKSTLAGISKSIASVRPSKRLICIKAHNWPAQRGASLARDLTVRFSRRRPFLSYPHARANRSSLFNPSPTATLRASVISFAYIRGRLRDSTNNNRRHSTAPTLERLYASGELQRGARAPN